MSDLTREQVEKLRVSHSTNEFGSSVVIALCDSWLAKDDACQEAINNEERAIQRAEAAEARIARLRELGDAVVDATEAPFYTDEEVRHPLPVAVLAWRKETTEGA